MKAILFFRLNPKRPTKLALDGGDSPPFSSVFPWTVRPGQAAFEFSLLPNIVHAHRAAMLRERKPLGASEPVDIS